MLVLAVGCLAVPAWLVAKPEYYYQPTGDKLFDRLAILMLDEYQRTRRTGQESSEDDSIDREIDYSAIAEWKDDFGDDPRYWELVYHVDMLNEALDRPYEWVAESGTYEPAENQQDILLADLLESGQARFGAVAQNLLPRLAALDEERALKLADRAIAEDPDNAYFYYLKSDLLVYLGEVPEAQQLVRQGNSTPKNYQPPMFPWEELDQYKDQFTTQDSKIAAAMIRECLALSEGLPNFIQIKDRYKEIEVCALLGFPVEIYDDYLLRAKRMGQMEGASYIYCTVAAVVSRILLYGFKDQLCDLTSEQLAEFRYITAGVDGYERWFAYLTPSSLYTPLANSVPAWSTDVHSYYSPDDWELTWEYAQQEQELILGARENFDILDPPPFAAWARGETLGLDLSGVQLPEGE